MKLWHLQMKLALLVTEGNNSVVQMENSKVIFDDSKMNPKCPHGPTLLLQQTTLKGTKYFYTCSAYRDRRLCSFHYPVEKDFSLLTQYLKDQEELQRLPISHTKYMKRLKKILTYSKENRSFCQTCSKLLLIGEKVDHLNKQHVVVCNIDFRIQLPTFLLCPLTENKAFAQYHFSEATVNFLIEQLKILNFSRVLCIGCPRIHETILSLHSTQFETLLLDIDYRHMQFNSDQQFCQYNLFNHWFFNNSAAENVFKNFICKSNGDGLVIVLDPPFGGLIAAISDTLNKIFGFWRNMCNKENGEIPILWFFPYFHQKRILKNHTSMQMLDYQVEYENQKNYKRRTWGSPVRIFTNLKPALFTLLSKNGYRFCHICQKYVAKNNKHCVWCDKCPSKNGANYTHCIKCGLCVKSSYKHCISCQKCHIPSYDCKNLPRTAHKKFHNKKIRYKKKITIKRKKWEGINRAINKF